ncbi:hypothetical protein FA95DRAFT_441211 [Auriscalpium vulgare]|uniref:Uncharacterized protein n=1 Tax=Auriscalpium vulgare TaxID=40419 RepID=A0ACB8RI02_9AGAM|nr:hypothetical protein FA95DRAFT_441211 [Auriscalpium vulgare]
MSPAPVDPLVFPPEIFLSIIDHAEQPVLRSLRATSRTPCALATPRAFRVLSCTGTEQRTSCFNQLTALPLVAEIVQQINYSCESTDSAELPDILSDSPLHGDMRNFPSLHTLAYTFPRNIIQSGTHPMNDPLVCLQRYASLHSKRDPRHLCALSLFATLLHTKMYAPVHSVSTTRMTSCPGPPSRRSRTSM